MMKRCIDLVLTCLGLVLVLPLFPVIGLLIKRDSRGPILYRCERLGKDGKLFKMYESIPLLVYGPKCESWREPGMPRNMR
jgi:O-antigen biosynthesis protein WbqP